MITLQHVSFFSPCYTYSLFGASRQCARPQFSCLLSCLQCPFPWLWWNLCLGCDFSLFVKHHWKRGHRRRNPCSTLPCSDFWEEAAGAGQTLSPAQHLERAAEAEMEASCWCPLSPSWRFFHCHAFFQPLLPSLFLRLPTSSVALEKDEHAHQEEAGELLCLFADTPLSLAVPTVTSPIHAGWLLSVLSGVCGVTDAAHRHLSQSTWRKEEKISHHYK